jgi:hypothetical protein
MTAPAQIVFFLDRVMLTRIPPRGQALGIGDEDLVGQRDSTRDGVGAVFVDFDFHLVVFGRQLSLSFSIR